MDKDVLRVLANFTKHYNSSKNPAEIAVSLTQLGVEDPDGSCDCESERPVGENGLLGWIHHHHREYNTMVRDILRTRPEMIPRVRRAIRRDLITNNDAEGRRYAQRLLDHFLSRSPTW